MKEAFKGTARQGNNCNCYSVMVICIVRSTDATDNLEESKNKSEQSQLDQIHGHVYAHGR